MVLDLRHKLDVAAFVAVVEEVDDLVVLLALVVEDVEGDLSGAENDILVAAVHVEDLDVELVGHVGDLEIGVLVVPLGVLAAVLAGGGVPVVVAEREVDAGVHLVEDVAFAVLDVGRLNIQVNVGHAR